MKQNDVKIYVLVTEDVYDIQRCSCQSKFRVSNILVNNKKSHPPSFKRNLISSILDSIKLNHFTSL